MPKLINEKKGMLKKVILTFHYSVALLSKRFLTAKGIIPESLKSIEQFKHV